MAAVIRRADGRILIARRADNAHQGGLWEFPGGKLESGEARLAGLIRELQEELGIQVTQARPLIDIRHDYPDKSIRLDVWLISGFTGQAHGAEGQPVRWVSAEQLSGFDFPEANRPIIMAAQLPECYLITPDGIDPATLDSDLGQFEPRGNGMIQLRQPSLPPEQYHALATAVLAEHADKATWILKGSQPVQGHGWHLTSPQLRQLHAAGWRRKPHTASPLPKENRSDHFRPEPKLDKSKQPQPGKVESHLDQRTNQPTTWPRWNSALPGTPAQALASETTDWQGLLAASCHSAEELQMAGKIGVDFATLSPVLPTGSHPDARPLGWETAADLIAQVNYPVYLLGGMDDSMLEKAFAIGAQGIAGISGLWPKA